MKQSKINKNYLRHTTASLHNLPAECKALISAMEQITGTRWRGVGTGDPDEKSRTNKPARAVYN